MQSRSRFPDHDATEATDQPVLTEPTTEPTTEPRHRRRRRTKRILLICLTVFVLLAGMGVLGAGLYLRSVEGGIERVDAFEDVPEQSRPVKEVPDAKNFLILGSDTRDPEALSGSRTDTIILAHLPRDRASAQLISIPRDTWVHVPKAKNGRYGDTDAKINAAFAWGGLPLMVQAVEEYTGIRIDNVVVVDFAGFKDIIDALGGVEITVEKAFTSTHSLLPGGRRQFKAGKQLMDGSMALDYARERYAFSDGDFARIKHQQDVIKAILDKAASGGVLSSPGSINDFLKATADAVAVDKTLSILDMAVEMRGLRGGNLRFFTSPSKGTGRVGTQSVVLPDREKAAKLFAAVRKDEVGDLESLAR